MANDFVHRTKQEIAKAKRVSAETLAQIERELERFPSADLWILRGDAIQLSEARNYDLEDAELSYRKALDIEPGSADAYESLAHFILAVKANARDSLPLFRRAIELGAGLSAHEGLRAAITDLAESDE